MSQAIIVSVDSAGRLLLPEASRKELGLSPGVTGRYHLGLRVAETDQGVITLGPQAFG